MDEKFDHRYNTRRASIVKENKFNEGRDLLDIFNQIYNEESLSERPNVSSASRNCSVPLSNSGKETRMLVPLPKVPMIKGDSQLGMKKGLSKRSDRSTSILSRI